MQDSSSKDTPRDAPRDTQDRKSAGGASSALSLNEPVPQGILLIAEPEEILQMPEIEAVVRDALSTPGTPAERRGAVAKALRDVREASRSLIAERFAEMCFAGRPMKHSYAYLTDALTTAALHAAQVIVADDIGSDGNGAGASGKGPEQEMAMLAVGGYGRGEMAPESDVDLLFLTRDDMTARNKAVIETTLYILWDLRLKVGQSSRTIAECLELGAEDFTIRTSLLEHRLISGSEALAGELADRLRKELFDGTEREFVKAKLEERDARHKKQGARYMLEPDVKEGKGGLRDLQSLYWIAKYTHGVDEPSDLVDPGVVTPEEFRRFERAEDFLWATRGHLHIATGTERNKLTFDMQVELARRMEYEDRGGRRAVELFMQDYFRHATVVGDLTRILLTKIGAPAERTRTSLLGRVLGRDSKAGSGASDAADVGAGFAVVQDRLAIADSEAFVADKLNMLRIFAEALRTGLLIHPDAMRLVSANLDLIDDTMRRDPEANGIFIDLLVGHGNPERALRRMNELGVLAAFIPEFEPIVAMMQFNMYHSFTVDEHTIQCVAQVSQIEKGELTEDLPVSSEILRGDLDRQVLYVALLLHDIGKGRETDHSVLGAQIARKVAPRLGLDKEQAETVEWLVRNHLLMSDTAQKRDISDPRTVHGFAKAVKTLKRLDLLLVLTTCDIRGVGPGTWNNWKASLLRSLYRETRRVLEDGMEALTRENLGEEARQRLRETLDDWNSDDIERELARHYDPYWQGLDVTAHADFARMLREIEGRGETDAPVAEFRDFADKDRDATRICFVNADHPGIFARIAGALALAGANIVDARSHTTRDGWVTDAFWVQDADGRPFDPDAMPRLTTSIGDALAGRSLDENAFKPKDKLKKRERDFRVPTNVTFDNDGSDIYTIVEVDTRDRPGLLHDLARTLANANVYIASAVIATFGEQVVDSFYVKDPAGLKFHSESKRSSLEAKLRKAIAEGAERAES